MKQIKDMTTAEWRKGWLDVMKIIADITDPLWQDGLCIFFADVTHVYIEDEMARFPGVPGMESYWFRFTPQGTEYRLTFAAMFAAMTPREFLEICEAPR